jgi:hypothetical protein
VQKGQAAENDPEGKGMQVTIRGNMSVYLEVGDVAENNYHHRIIVKQGKSLSHNKAAKFGWSLVKDWVVLDTDPIAIPLCTANETVRKELKANRLVFESATTYFLIPIFCLRLLKALLLHECTSVAEALRKMRVGNETILWCDSSTHSLHVLIMYDACLLTG